jgi:LacI family transcriptional regulator
MGTTIRDIATAAGVSVAAVSRVLHGSGGNIRISEKRAEEIKRVAEELHYVPNQTARNLRRGKTRTIGLIFENFGSIAAGPLYYAYLFDGITSVVFANHYKLTILPEIDHENAHVELRSGQLDGVIWCKFLESSKMVRALEKSGVPIVALNSLPLEMPRGSCSIRCDNDAGMELIIDHLFQLGHQKIAFVQEVLEERTPDLVARLEGFKGAMARRGLAVNPDDILTWGVEATDLPKWWSQRTGHTAVAVWNELQASNILRRALNAGISIPTELSVVGFDSTAYCETTIPTLTAVNQPITEMAKTAAEVLLNLIEGKPIADSSIIFPCSLDVRGSTSVLIRSSVS